VVLAVDLLAKLYHFIMAAAFFFIAFFIAGAGAAAFIAFFIAMVDERVGRSKLQQTLS
jgi:hypothetical protein